MKNLKRTSHKVKSVSRASIMDNLFGNNPSYLGFAVTLILVMVGFVYLFIPQEFKNSTNQEIWQILCTLINTTICYSFGAASNSKNR